MSKLEDYLNSAEYLNLMNTYFRLSGCPASELFNRIKAAILAATSEQDTTTVAPVPKYKPGDRVQMTGTFQMNFKLPDWGSGEVLESFIDVTGVVYKIKFQDGDVWCREPDLEPLPDPLEELAQTLDKLANMHCSVDVGKRMAYQHAAKLVRDLARRGK